MKLGEVGDLPPTLDAEQAADLLGISTWTLYDLVRRGEAPVAPLKLGRRLRFPTARLLAVLGLDEGDPHESRPVSSLKGVAPAGQEATG